MKIDARKVGTSPIDRSAQADIADHGVHRLGAPGGPTTDELTHEALPQGGFLPPAAAPNLPRPGIIAEPAARPAGDPSVPTRRPLTRIDFQNSAVIVAAGRQIAAQHQIVDGLPMPSAPLFTVQDALGRLQNVQQSVYKSAVCGLDGEQMRAAIIYLGERIVQWQPQRVRGAYNYYPQAMQFDEQLQLTTTPDLDHHGVHTSAEIINRLGFTARLSPAQTDELLAAYTDELYGRPPSPQERTASAQARYLFDLLYYCYFLDLSFVSEGGGAQHPRLQLPALQQAELMLLRLREDQALLEDVGLPKVTLP